MKIKCVVRLICGLTLLSTAVLGQKRPELSPSPIMGWNSWNWFGPKEINEEIVLDVIDAIVESGLRDAGYKYIIIDGGWREDFLDKDGKLLASKERFPRGMKFIADYAHEHGMKFGLHSVPGRYDCRNNPMGSYEHKDLHLSQFLEWGLDFIKLDKCRMLIGKGDGWTPELVKEEYTTWSKMLAECGRDIVYSTSTYVYRDWYPELCNMGRTTGDISCRLYGGARFEGGERKGAGWSVMRIADKNNEYAQYAGNGYWNDPDMLAVGDQGLTPEEQKIHFALWCVMSSPLLLGNDPRTMSPEELALISNKECIAVNQDPTEQGRRILKQDNGTEVWVKNLANGDQAILLMNRNKTPNEIEVNFKALGLSERMFVRDLYNHKNLGKQSDLKATFTDRGSMFVRVSAKKIK